MTDAPAGTARAPLSERVLQGDPRAVARAISLIEDEAAEGVELVADLSSESAPDRNRESGPKLQTLRVRWDGRGDGHGHNGAEQEEGGQTPSLFENAFHRDLSI